MPIILRICITRSLTFSMIDNELCLPSRKCIKGAPKLHSLVSTILSGGARFVHRRSMHRLCILEALL